MSATCRLCLLSSSLFFGILEGVQKEMKWSGDTQFNILTSSLLHLCISGLWLGMHSSGGMKVRPGSKTCSGFAPLGSGIGAGKLVRSFWTASIASVAKAMVTIVWGRRGDARRTEQTRCSTNGSLGAVRDWQRSGAERPDKVTPLGGMFSREGEHGSGEQHAREVQGWLIW